MHPTEKALREQIERLRERNASLSVQVDVRGEHIDLLSYDNVRYSEVACNLKDLLAFCRHSGSVPSLQVLEECLEGKHLDHLITDLPNPKMSEL